MKELIRRGESGGQVSDWNPSSDTVTAPSQQSFFAPHGLTLRQTITSSGSVTIPAGIEWVYVVLTGAGGTGDFGGSGAGGLAWGWTLAQNTCIIGAGGSPGGYTRYGHIIAGGGGTRSFTPFLGGAPGRTESGATNYYGQPGGTSGNAGIAAGGPFNITGASGYNGVSASGGLNSTTAGTPAGNGGSGIIGGGGGPHYNTTGTRIGGNGGSGVGIDGTIYTGGTGATSTTGDAAGGGGAGIAGNGGNASTFTPGNGGLGGGGGGGGNGLNGTGGAGILYIFY